MSIISALFKEPKTPRQFLVGVTLHFGFWIALYTWLLYAVFKVPIGWVLWIMGGTSVVVAIASRFGYRLWLARNNYDTVQTGPQTRVPFRQMIRVLPMTGAAVLVWSAAYFFWRGDHLAAWVLGLCAAGLSFVALNELRKLLPPPSTLPAESIEAVILDPVRSFRVFVIGWLALLPLISAGIFMWVGAFPIAAVLFGLFAAVCPFAVRRIRAVLQP